jgi:hypothetical protein
VYVTAQRWKKAKRVLPGTVTQDGDDEGIVRLDRLPTPAEAETIRDLIGIRKRRSMTTEAWASLERARELNRPFLTRLCVFLRGPLPRYMPAHDSSATASTPA